MKKPAEILEFIFFCSCVLAIVIAGIELYLSAIHSCHVSNEFCSNYDFPALLAVYAYSLIWFFPAFTAPVLTLRNIRKVTYGVSLSVFEIVQTFVYLISTLILIYLIRLGLGIFI